MTSTASGNGNRRWRSTYKHILNHVRTMDRICTECAVLSNHLALLAHQLDDGELVILALAANDVARALHAHVAWLLESGRVAA